MKEDKFIQTDLFNNVNNKNDDRGKIIKPSKFFFSYSKMSLYLECPLKYKFKYIDKLPEKPKSYFAFGQNIHYALEFFHSKLPPPSYEELENFFTLHWQKKDYIQKGYLFPQKEEEDYNKGLKVLRAYYQKHYQIDKMPFLLEYSTDVEVDGITVKIIADKIEYLGDGNIIIVDYKTGKEGNRNSDQLLMYQKIIEADKNLIERIYQKYQEKVLNVKVKNMLYYYVEPLKEKVFDRADDKEINIFWEKALNVVENIKSEKFAPNPGELQCKYCDFKEFCPIFNKKNIKIKKIDIDDDILKYAENQIKIKDLEDENNKLSEKITLKYKDFPLNFENEKLEIIVNEKEKKEFKNKEEIIKILKENGLYDSCLRLTFQSINELLNNEKVSLEVKNKINSLSEVKKYLDFNIKRKE